MTERPLSKRDQALLVRLADGTLSARGRKRGCARSRTPTA